MAWSMAKVSNFFALQYPGTNLLGKKSKRLVSLPLDCRPHIISINSNFLIMTWLTFCIICKCSYTYQKTNILQNLCYQQPILLSREFILPNPIIYWIRFKANSHESISVQLFISKFSAQVPLSEQLEVIKIILFSPAPSFNKSHDVIISRIMVPALKSGYRIS